VNSVSLRKEWARIATRTPAIPADPAEFATQRLKLDPDPWQARVLSVAAGEGAQTILNCGRQVGKSTTAATLALHTALREPGSLVLIVAPAQRQAQEMFSTCAKLYRALGNAPSADSHRKMGMQLKNGSRIEALPGTERTIRGFASVRMLILDEASRIDGELYHALRPMLAVAGGSLLMCSTPYEQAGVFYEIWSNPQGWHTEEIPSTECPRIPIEFLESERAALPERIFRREYMCEFTGSDTRVFTEESVIAIADNELEAVHAF
jgi:hypothetical protein